MDRLRHIVLLLAAAILSANIQCAADCIVQPCHPPKASQASATPEVPPCHERQPSPERSDDKLCRHAAFVAENRPASGLNATVAPTVVIGIVAAQEPALTSMLDTQRWLARVNASGESAAVAAFAVLRI